MKIVIQSLVFFLVVVLFGTIIEIKLNNKKVETEQKVEEVDLPQIELQEVKLVVPTILEKSIQICRTEYAEEIAAAVIKSSERHGIPVWVIYAIIATESGNFRTNENINEENILDVNPKAKSKCNCYGLMQISKYALAEYNKYYKTNHTIDDLYNIRINIDIGTWYYKQFKSVVDNYVSLYIIYNVGYGDYKRINHNSFFDVNGVWHNNYPNSFFWENNLFPPEISNKGMIGKNKLKDYNAKIRFQKCLEVCYNYFN